MKELSDLININRLNALAGDLVRIPSINPPGNVEACVDRLMKLFERHGVHGRVVSKFEGKPNFVAELGHGSPVLLWNGHLDVVTAGEEKWEHDPFGGAIKDGFLWGRGSVDMKGSVSSMAEAFLMLAESGRELKGTLKMTAVSDEENFGVAGTRLLADEGEVKADFAIVGEPTNLGVEVVQRGIMWFDIIAHGKTSHGARPHLGINAIENMVEVVKILKDRLSPLLKERSHPLLSPPCISITMFHGGEKVNVIPDYCKLSGDRRIIPGEKEEDVRREIEEVVREYRTDENRLEFNVQKLVLPTETSSDHPLVQTLLKNIERVTGEKKNIAGKDAGTDAYIINAQLGVPTVMFGPGDFRLSHRPNEHIPLEDMAQAAKIHYLTALNMLGVGL
ncbi:MAG: M20 family metallopeptidase [Deltaproteobacteria bacterium]|nr:M20 family metallopeptidase [Deltaproteobacteria bacterium]